MTKYQRRSPKTSPRFGGEHAHLAGERRRDQHQRHRDRLNQVQLGGVRGPVAAAWARAVKYIANSPAKNISSLDSHTMVPTLTMLGRFSECTRDVIAVPEVPTALVTPQV